MHGTTYDKQQRILRAKHLLARKGYSYTNNIAGQLVQEFEVCYTTAYEYLREARKEILEQSKKTCEEHIEDTLNSLEEMIANNPDEKVRLKAIETKIKMLGLSPNRTVNINIEKPMFNPEQQKQLLTNTDLQNAILNLDKILEINNESIYTTDAR